MSGEDLVGISTEAYEAMSDEQLLAFVQPLLEATRPKNVVVEETKEDKTPKKTKAKKPTMEDMFAQALSLFNEVKKNEP